MNSKLYFIVLIILLYSHMSCTKKEDDMEIPYARVYKVDDVKFRLFEQGVQIVPSIASFDEVFDDNSRNFYAGRDSVLMYKMNNNSLSNKWGYAAYVCVLDWRIKRIDIVTLSDLDENHPAGTNINDMMDASYCYKRVIINQRLNSIKYGTLMLTDYCPYDASESGGAMIEVYILQEEILKGLRLKSIDVHIIDGFDREFSATLESAIHL